MILGCKNLKHCKIISPIINRGKVISVTKRSIFVNKNKQTLKPTSGQLRYNFSINKFQLSVFLSLESSQFIDSTQLTHKAKGVKSNSLTEIACT